MLIGAVITASEVAKYVGFTVIFGGITRGLQTIVAKKTMDAYGKMKKVANGIKK